MLPRSWTRLGPRSVAAGGGGDLAGRVSGDGGPPPRPCRHAERPREAEQDGGGAAAGGAAPAALARLLDAAPGSQEAGELHAVRNTTRASSTPTTSTAPAWTTDSASRRSRRVMAVSLENAMMERREGARVLRALVAHSTDCLAELNLWCAFQVGHSPMLGGAKESEFVRVLSLLRALKVLAINYAYLADNTGTALLGLLAVTNGT
ncbi:uncharacterized protein LOC113205499 [Frankliniella occidentalis]|uniref:Uncharacterized protein LOC113205499 n=1 Tax=Frankliniella occidentalis TaxID=133901 RepID=A0A9C6XAC9_FRAOC|nr:uncharacterized protein LOC113205499 [Frankliniella occidentalis]